MAMERAGPGPGLARLHRGQVGEEHARPEPGEHEAHQAAATAQLQDAPALPRGG